MRFRTQFPIPFFCLPPLVELELAINHTQVHKPPSSFFSFSRASRMLLSNGPSFLCLSSLFYFYFYFYFYYFFPLPFFS